VTATAGASASDEPALVVGASGVRDPATSFPCFDGLRAIAAIVVLLHHASFYSGQMFHGHFPAYFTHLDIGVAIFFLISGFLLYRPFVAAALADRPGPSLRRFFVRRLLRIYPAYWLALIGIMIFFGLSVPVHGARSYLEYFTLTQTYDNLARATGGISQAWTLAVEVSFYVFLPIYAAVVARLHRGRATLARLRIEIAGLGVLYATSLAFRALVFELHSGRIHDLGIYWLPANLDYFALGMGLALASAWYAQRRSVPRPVEYLADRPVLSWALAVACFVLMAKGLHLPVGLVRVDGKRAYARQFLYGATAFFVLFPAVFGPQDRSMVRRFLRWPPLVYVGLVSYGVYLWHQSWLERAVKWNAQPDFHASFPAIVTVGFALTMVTASVSWFALERPLLRRRDRYRPARAAEAAP
jgi:peptidoglycan/LPS O-acetylase OafA/YrhL